MFNWGELGRRHWTVSRKTCTDEVIAGISCYLSHTGSPLRGIGPGHASRWLATSGMTTSNANRMNSTPCKIMTQQLILLSMVCCTKFHDSMSSKKYPRVVSATPSPHALISSKITFQSCPTYFGLRPLPVAHYRNADQDVFLSSKSTRLQLRRGMLQALGCRRGQSSRSAPGQKRRNTETSPAASHLGQRNAPFVPQVGHGYSNSRVPLCSSLTPVPSHLAQETIMPVPTQALQSG